MTSSPADALTRLKDALGPRGWLEAPADTLKYRTDWRGRHGGEALMVARPSSTAETAAVVAARVGWRAATETDSWVIEGRGSPR